MAGGGFLSSSGTHSLLTLPEFLKSKSPTQFTVFCRNMFLSFLAPLAFL